MTLYDVLDVDRTAPPETVKRAYRRKAKEAHSDKGGSDEEMRRLNGAYAIISDPVRRQRYDETGDTGEQQAPDDEAERNLARMFTEVMARDEPEKDLVKNLRRAVSANLDQLRRGEGACVAQLARAQAVIDRLAFSGQGNNVLLAVAEASLAGAKATQATLAHQKIVGERMLELLKAYQYRADEERVIQPTAWSARQAQSIFFNEGGRYA